MYRGVTCGGGDERRGDIWGDGEAKRQAGRRGLARERTRRVSRSGREREDRHICAFDAELEAMSSTTSGATLQRSSSTASSMSSSNEHVAGTHPAPQLRHAEPRTPKRTTPSNRNALSEIQKCHVTGFVNFVEVQPSVGRFKVDDQEPPAARVKLSDVLVPTIAPECNYGVFPTHDNDLRHG